MPGEYVGGTGRRRWAIEIAGQQEKRGSPNLKLDLASGEALQHLVALEYPNVQATVRETALGSHVIAIRPYRDLRIVGGDLHTGRCLGREGIKVPSVRDGIWALRDADALNALVELKLANHPAIGEHIIAYDRITGIRCPTRRTDAGPERVNGDGAEQFCPRLTIDGDGLIHHFNIVIAAHRSGDVRRHNPAGLLRDTLYTSDDRSCRRQAGRRCERVLPQGIRRAPIGHGSERACSLKIAALANWSARFSHRRGRHRYGSIDECVGARGTNWRAHKRLTDRLSTSLARKQQPRSGNGRQSDKNNRTTPFHILRTDAWHDVLPLVCYLRWPSDVWRSCRSCTGLSGVCGCTVGKVRRS